MEKIIEEIRRNLAAQVPNFALTFPSFTVEVETNFEDGMVDDLPGEIIVEKTSNVIHVTYYAIPAERMSAWMLKLLALRMYCMITCSIAGQEQNETLLDAMVLLYSRTMWNLNLYPTTTARFYYRAFQINAAPGCNQRMVIAVRSYIDQRDANARAMIHRLTAGGIVNEIINASEGWTTETKMNTLFACLMKAA